jgi:hypothetical protein
MKRMHQVGYSILALVAAVTFALRPAGRTSAATRANIAKSVAPHPTSQAQAVGTYGKFPLSFVANQGQTDSRVKFLSRGSGYSLFLTEDEAVLSLHKAADKAPTFKSATAGVKFGPTNSLNKLTTDKDPRSVLRMKLLGANTNALVTGADELPGKTNYFVGNDPKKWRTNVPTYSKVRYSSVYPGIDLVYYGNQGGQLEYDFVVAPGADPNLISFNVGADGVRPEEGERRSPLQLDPNGDLILRADGGNICFQKPVVYQEQSTVDSSELTVPDKKRNPANPKSKIQNRKFLEGHYTIDAQNRIRFHVDAYDHSKPLIIDPALAYSTLLGGTSGITEGLAVATYTEPSTGHVYAYVSGYTSAPDFPTVGGLHRTFDGEDVFVTKFDPAASGAGSVVYSTYLGGAGFQIPRGIGVDSGGNASVTGTTSSTSFPLMNAYQTIYKAQPNTSTAFLAKLSLDGSALMYSTFFGGSVTDTASAIGLDSAGRAYIVGGASSPDLPTVNPYQGTGSGFLAAFDTTRSGFNSLIYSTYLPGPAAAVAVDGSGAVHLGGSGIFPIVNGFQTTPGGFYAKLNTSASGTAQLVYSTYVGGPRTGVAAIAVDPAGNAYLTTGSNTSSNSLVVKINPFQAGPPSLVYSTSMLGMTPLSIAVNASGNAFLGGSAGYGLPMVNPAIPALTGVFQSNTAGQSWTELGQQSPSWDLPIIALVVDASTSPRTLYAGTGIGTILSSSDGCLTWNRVFQGPSSTVIRCGNTFRAATNNCVMALAVDPSAPSNVYAGTSAGVYKSSDRGATWNPFNTGLSSTAVQQGVIGLTFDGGTLYAGAPDGLYKLTPGASSWTSTSLAVDVGNIAIDPTTVPHIIYTSSQSSGLYKSADGGSTWTALGSGSVFSSIAVDTSTSPPTLYAYDGYDANNYLARSSDGGMTWAILPDPGLSQNIPVVTIAFDTSQMPPTLYVLDSNAGIFKSADSGASWTTIEEANIAQGALTLDPTTGSATTPATLYAGSDFTNGGAYVAELNSAGSAIVFSTYLGLTQGRALALDAADNIYITGDYAPAPTFDNFAAFPAVNSFQSSIGLNANVGAFLIKLGSQTLPENSSGSVSAQTVVPTGTLTITFPDITGSTTSSPPTLTVTPVSSATTTNFSLSNNLGAYDISTTAEYSGSVTLCFQAQTVNDFSTFSNLQILHIVNGSPVNVTTSYNFSTRTICGAVTSFSPFVIVKGAAGQLNDLVRTVNESNIRHGIQNSLDAKIQNAVSALNSAHNNSYGTVCNLMGAFISSVQAQEGQAITTGEATAFISAANQIKATLGCQ